MCQIYHIKLHSIEFIDILTRYARSLIFSGRIRLDKKYTILIYTCRQITQPLVESEWV